MDWHHTLEYNNKVNQSTMNALQKLLNQGDVHILSYVETNWRKEKVHEQVEELLPYHLFVQLHGVSTCWRRVGPQGKLAFCQQIGAEAIIDDNNEIITECLNAGLHAFGTTFRNTQHGNIPIKYVCDSFYEAVQGVLEVMQ